MNKLTFNIGQASKRGPREANEDAAAISPYHDFFAIADGIGGAPLGDVASTLSCNVAAQAYEETPCLASSFDRANKAVIALKQALWTHNPASCNLAPLPTTALSRSPDGRAAAREPYARTRHATPASGAGCTLLLARVDAERMSFAWAGDTIAMRLRGSSLQIVAEPDNIDGTNQLGSALGYEADLAPLRADCDVKAGDRFLLCTDGVWGELDHARLAELLASSNNAPWLAEIITKEAAEQGHDNATAIVIVVIESDEDCPDDMPPEALDVPRVPCTPSYPAISYL